MGNCTFCGKPAGFLSRKHAACVDKNERGNDAIADILVEAALTGKGLDNLPNSVKSAAADAFLNPPEDMQAVLMAGWRAAVHRAVAKNSISESDICGLTIYMHHFDLRSHGLQAHEEYEIYKMATVTVALNKGNLLPTDAKPPFVMLKSESLLWLFDSSSYHKVVAKRSFHGGSGGASFRVAKGVTLRTGGFKGQSVSTDVLEHIDDGVFGITSKHLYFKGNKKSFRVKLEKIVSYQINGNTLEIMRDAANAKAEHFALGDYESKFCKNLLDFAYDGDLMGMPSESKSIEEVVEDQGSFVAYMGSI